MKFFAKSLLLILPLVFLPMVHAELSINNEEYTPFTQAKWKTRPNITVSQLECLSKSHINVVVALQVGTQGEVKAIYFLKSSGNPLLDKRIIHQLKTAEFYPFTKNGEPIEGIINLPIRIFCPSLPSFTNFTPSFTNIEINRRKDIQLQELSKSLDKQ